MKRIKIKAWDKKNRCWLDFSNPILYKPGFKYFFYSHEGNIIEIDLHNRVSIREIDNILTVFYSGMKDADDEELYTGDVFIYEDKKYLLFWDDENHCLTLPKRDEKNKIKRLGHIYRNPDLLYDNDIKQYKQDKDL